MPEKIYYCKSRDGEVIAKGVWRDATFVVLAGSIVRGGYFANKVMVNNGVMVRDGKVFRVEKNFGFPKPGPAAEFALGRHASGWTVWKTESGETMRDSPSTL
jgi:hypothetical protein